MDIRIMMISTSGQNTDIVIIIMIMILIIAMIMVMIMTVVRSSNSNNKANDNNNNIVGYYGGKNGGAGRASWQYLPRHPLILGRTSSMQCKPQAQKQTSEDAIWESNRSY